jgi:hypothetical protein
MFALREALVPLRTPRADSSNGGAQMSEQTVVSNQKQILKNQKNILSNQAQIKSNQDTIKKNQGIILKNQGAILKNQTTLNTIIKNQQEILALLKK